MKILLQFLLFSTIFCYLLLDFHVKTGTGFSLQDKQLFEIMRVNCIIKSVMGIPHLSGAMVLTIICISLYSRYDSRVKAMEVDERPTEQYSDIGGLDKQIQEVF